MTIDQKNADSIAQLEHYITDQKPVLKKHYEHLLTRDLSQQQWEGCFQRNVVIVLQQFLFNQFTQQVEDSIFEYCVAKITSSKGKITIQELEKKTGYSSRWLNMKFADKLGISPKNFSTIIRFNEYYNAVANNNEMEFMQNAFYDHYYDQSHFLKEFKRFTGQSHSGFVNRTNDFGKLFYKE